MFFTSPFSDLTHWSVVASFPDFPHLYFCVAPVNQDLTPRIPCHRPWCPGWWRSEYGGGGPGSSGFWLEVALHGSWSFIS